MATKSNKSNSNTNAGKTGKKQTASSTKPSVEVNTKVITNSDTTDNSKKSKVISKKTKSDKSSKNSKETKAKKPKIPKILKGKSPFRGYFVGSWREIRQVKWPDRKTSWKLTFSVLVFSVVFSAFLAGLDYAFEQLAKLIFMK